MKIIAISHQNANIFAVANQNETIMKRTQVSFLVALLIIAFSATGCKSSSYKDSDRPTSFSLNDLYSGSPTKMRFDTVRKKDARSMAHEMISEKWTLDVIRGSEVQIGTEDQK